MITIVTRKQQTADLNVKLIPSEIALFKYLLVEFSDSYWEEVSRHSLDEKIDIPSIQLIEIQNKLTARDKDIEKFFESYKEYYPIDSSIEDTKDKFIAIIKEVLKSADKSDGEITIII